MPITTKKLAIDFGTINTRIMAPKKGIVVNEPTVIAIDESSANDKRKIVAVGAYAHAMIGKTPDEVTIISPMQSGVIANFEAAGHTLERFIQQSSGRFHLNRPIAMRPVSATSTSTEKKALIDAGIEAGLQTVYLINAASAAALGAGLSITDPVGCMVINLGGGTTETGIFSLGGTVSEGAIRTAGNDIDDAIRLYARRELGVNLSARSVFRIKSKFLDITSTENDSMTVVGQAVVGGLPKKVTLRQRQLASYVDMPLDTIVRSIKATLEKTPPDVVGDIVKHGLLLTGGTSQIKGIDTYLAKRINIACIIAQQPQLCCIKGANMALTHLEDYQRSLLA